MKLETLAVPPDYHVISLTGAVVAPIHLSMTFEARGGWSYPAGNMYSRWNNPNRERWSSARRLSRGAAAAAFSSGSRPRWLFSGALSDDHVSRSADVFYGTRACYRTSSRAGAWRPCFVD